MPGRNALIMRREEREGTMPNQHDLWRDYALGALPRMSQRNVCVFSTFS